VVEKSAGTSTDYRCTCYTNLLPKFYSKLLDKMVISGDFFGDGKHLRIRQISKYVAPSYGFILLVRIDLRSILEIVCAQIDNVYKGLPSE
jgi:hypothetical protein